MLLSSVLYLVNHTSTSEVVTFWNFGRRRG